MLYQFDPMNLEQEITILLTKQLRHLRGYNAVTQREIADALCIDRSTYAYYELGETQPSLLMLVRLARLYDVTTDYLLGIQPEEKQPTPFERELLSLVEMYFPNGGEGYETCSRF